MAKKQSGSRLCCITDPTPSALEIRLYQAEDYRVLGKVQYMEKGSREVKPLPIGLEPG